MQKAPTEGGEDIIGHTPLDTISLRGKRIARMEELTSYHKSP
ncbi:hypothetical protein HMPREF9134_01792 [Porphyromonas catoniae F0037]|uniref:Uncharacterized protein n=1 Tax=Porphyromonas catoniae F0037 TaxID=1127696 RepID=L1N984_9PORP|nr:hypothetical protein HMPREF9134_01792 [Porphyromonas catoniae F0037]